uniref:MFS transporter n=1 Tax=Cyberlindnera americana TaxID=36016 RepID=A0A5P8N8H2_9ASCO|nr:MFS transporter [Cyberlindnera americana]
MAKTQESFRDQMRTFPWAQVLVIALVRFSEPITFTSLFPYCYFMVRDFGIAKSEAEVSMYSGYLSSIFAFCQMIMGFQWGRFADKHGRKPTLMIGLTGSIVSSLLLGFSKNYWTAFVARGILGSLNGNVAVIRTLLGEVATERKHQAIAFSVMPMVWQFGSILGPMIGGYLSGKGSRFDFLRPMTEKYPYALPNITVALCVLGSMIVMMVFLEETHSKHKYRRDYFVELGDLIKKHIFGVTPKTRLWNTTVTTKRHTVIKSSSATLDEESPLLDSESELNSDDEDQCTSYTTPQPLRNPDQRRDSDASDDSVQSIGQVLSRRQSRALIRAYSMHEEGDDANASYRALLTPAIFYAVICSFITALHTTVFEEFIPVFLAYEVARDDDGKLSSKFPFRTSGGLQYSAEDTGTLLSSTGILGVFLIIVVFPYVDRNYDSLVTYKRFTAIFPVLYFCIPYLVFLADYRIISHLAVYMVTCMKTLAHSMANPQILLIIHNCSPAKHRAMINGATISVNALARCIGPFVWGYLMTWGEENNISWLPWWSIVLMTLLAMYQSHFLRDSNDDDPEE